MIGAEEILRVHAHSCDKPFEMMTPSPPGKKGQARRGKTNTLIEGAVLNGNSAVGHGTTLPDVDPLPAPYRSTTDTTRSALVPEAAHRSISKASTASLQPNVNCPAILFIIRWIVKAARNSILCRKLTLLPYTPVPLSTVQRIPGAAYLDPEVGAGCPVNLEEQWLTPAR
jgi:hypothetical protein